VPERRGGKQLLKQLHQEQRCPRLIRIWVVELRSAESVGGYSGEDFLRWCLRCVGGSLKWFSGTRAPQDLWSCLDDELWRESIDGCTGVVV
jgi:hypothetical protein